MDAKWEAERRFKNSDRYRQSSSRDSKANKLLSFAPSVLKKFAKEAGCEFEHKGQRSSWGDCLAVYYHYEHVDSFWGKKKDKTSEVIIGLRKFNINAGYLYEGVLMLNYGSYGEKESLDEINEEWFMRILAKAYV